MFGSQASQCRGLLLMLTTGAEPRSQVQVTAGSYLMKAAGSRAVDAGHLLTVHHVQAFVVRLVLQQSGPFYPVSPLHRTPADYPVNTHLNLPVTAALAPTERSI